jgi:glycosyltransferase involved in cell wall biosynthesis
MRVGIMSPGLSAGDAIGNDILGMYAISRQLGYETFLFTPDGSAGVALEVYSYNDVDWLLSRPDDLLIYHCCTWDSAGMKILRQLDCKIAIKYHNVTPSAYMAEYSTDFTKGTRMGREQLVEFANLPVVRFVSDSTFNAEELERFGAPQALRTVLAPFHHVDELLGQADAPRTEAQITAHTNNIVAVGRVVPNKGLDTLIEGLADLRRKRGPPVHLHVVGPHDHRMHAYKTKLLEIIARAGLQQNVTFHGTVTAQELATFYRHCAIFCTTSRHEGFCVPAVEAMAFGKPIISSRAGALPETCGDAAVYYDSIEDLGQKLATLLVDDEARVMLGRAGRARYERQFRNVHTEQGFVTLLRELETQTESEPVLTTAMDWLGLPQAEKVIAATLGLSEAPVYRAGQDAQLDLLDWMVRTGAARSKVIRSYLQSKPLWDYAARIAMPASAAHLTPAMRLAWLFSRRAQALFDLRDSSQTAGFVRWYRREGGVYEALHEAVAVHS